MVTDQTYNYLTAEDQMKVIRLPNVWIISSKPDSNLCSVETPLTRP